MRFFADQINYILILSYNAVSLCAIKSVGHQTSK